MWVNNGSAVFNDLEFLGAPEQTDLKIELKSKSINFEELKYFTNVDNIKNVFSVNFWQCLEGEWISGFKCEPCNVGSFSLKNSSEECEACIENA